MPVSKVRPETLRISSSPLPRPRKNKSTLLPSQLPFSLPQNKPFVPPSLPVHLPEKQGSSSYSVIYQFLCLIQTLSIPPLQPLWPHYNPFGQFESVNGYFKHCLPTMLNLCMKTLHFQHRMHGNRACLAHG